MNHVQRRARATMPAELPIDLHTLLAHRSSAMIPDYHSLYSHAEELMSGVADDVVQGAIDEEGRVLSERVKEERLGMAGWRAWKMLKLLYRVAERRGIRLKVPDLQAQPTNGAEP